jgi:murein DD-endopeptidase
MMKKFIAAIAMTAVVTASLFSTVGGEKAEAATYNYHTKAIAVAKANLGVPYRWGGMSPSGFDCSGLVKYSYGKAGRTLSRTASQMYYSNGYKVRYAQRGDLLFFAPNKASRPTHVAIYLGYGKMIMASSSRGVIVTSVNNVYWKPRYIGAKHV